jgi:hypothetical protein
MPTPLTPALYKWVDHPNDAANNEEITDLDFDLGADEALEILHYKVRIHTNNSTAWRGVHVVTLDLEETGPGIDTIDDLDHIIGFWFEANRELTTSGASLYTAPPDGFWDEVLPPGILLAQNLRIITNFIAGATTGCRLLTQLWYRIVRLQARDLEGLIAMARARR